VPAVEIDRRVPISPAMSDAPWNSAPSRISPPPIPVPIVRPITLRPPRAEPCHHSPNVAQFASLSSVVGSRSRSWIGSRSGKSFQPRFGATSTIPRSRSKGPGAPTPMPTKSCRVAPVSLIASRKTPPRARRSARPPPRPRRGVRRDRAHRQMLRAVERQRAATMFVPPRSTPMMYCSRPVVMRVRLV
jgi:hypothetical protein